MAMAFIVIWIYNLTWSVVLCEFYHVISNTAEAMGFSKWPERTLRLEN